MALLIFSELQDKFSRIEFNIFWDGNSVETYISPKIVIVSVGYK